MIKLIEIVQDNENLRMMKKYGAAAKRAASHLLTRKGLEEADYFILRIKEFKKDKDWVAMYRSHSVMSGRPIFWINALLPEIAKEQGVDFPMVRIMTDNILHEWFHAICEALRMFRMRGGRSKQTWTILTKKKWPRSSSRGAAGMRGESFRMKKTASSRRQYRSSTDYGNKATTFGVRSLRRLPPISCS
jgi:hypothetical protein